MSGGRGGTVPTWIERALAVIAKIDAFRERYGSKMSRETDDVSKESVEVIKGLLKYAESEFERGRVKGAAETRMKARVSFDGEVRPERSGYMQSQGDYARNVQDQAARDYRGY